MGGFLRGPEVTRTQEPSATFARITHANVGFCRMVGFLRVAEVPRTQRTELRICKDCIGKCRLPMHGCVRAKFGCHTHTNDPIPAMQ